MKQDDAHALRTSGLRSAVRPLVLTGEPGSTPPRMLSEAAKERAGHGSSLVTIDPDTRFWRRGGSRLERMAAASRQISARRGQMLGMLLAATTSSCCSRQTASRPLWANEAMHRAYSLIQLVRDLDLCTPAGCRNPDK